MLTSEQEAQVRFAYRVYSTGSTYGSPAAAVKAANDLIDKVVEACGQVRTIDARLFSSVATDIISK